MEIREAKVKDVPAVTELAMGLLQHHAGLDDYFRPAKDAKKVYERFFTRCVYSRNHLLLVAEDRGKIVGYSVSEIKKRPPVFETKDIGFINEMFLVPSYRSKGLGRLFLDSIYSWFRSKRVMHVELHVHVRNEVAKSAWKRYGFRDVMVTQRSSIGKRR